MMKKTVEICFGGGSNGAKTKNFGFVLRFKPLFCQSTSTNPTKVAEQVYLAVLQHPTKLMTGKFYS